MNVNRWALLVFGLLLVCILCASIPAKAGFLVPGGILFYHSPYNYAPSMFQDGSRQYFWWCGNGQSPSTGQWRM